MLKRNRPEIIIQVNDTSHKVAKFIIKSESRVIIYKNDKAVKLARLYAANDPLFYLWLKYQ